MKPIIVSIVIVLGIGQFSCKSNKDKCDECPTFSKKQTIEQKQFEY